MPRFYIDTLTFQEIMIKLPTGIAQHLNVLRYKDGEKITLFNGKGRSCIGEIISLHKKEALVKILEDRYAEEILPRLELGLSLISTDKMELSLRGATELGVTTITPLITQYSQRIHKERLENRMEHWKKILISSAEQCERDYIPRLNLPVSFETYVTENACKYKYILSLTQNQNSIAIKNLEQNISLIIGPEGGFTEDEIKIALEHNFSSIKPWPHILRTETAVVAGLSLLRHYAS